MKGSYVKVKEKLDKNVLNWKVGMKKSHKKKKVLKKLIIKESIIDDLKYN